MTDKEEETLYAAMRIMIVRRGRFHLDILMELDSPEYALGCSSAVRTDDSAESNEQVDWVIKATFEQMLREWREMGDEDAKETDRFAN